MTFDEYQKAAMRTAGKALDGDYKTSLALVGLGLTGEAGEVADLIKKILFHDHAPDPEKLKKDLGDVLWYVARGAQALGVSMNDIAEGNIRKLEERYPEGFTPEQSKNRSEDPVMVLLRRFVQVLEEDHGRSVLLSSRLLNEMNEARKLLQKPPHDDKSLCPECNSYKIGEHQSWCPLK